MYNTIPAYGKYENQTERTLVTFFFLTVFFCTVFFLPFFFVCYDTVHGDDAVDVPLLVLSYLGLIGAAIGKDQGAEGRHRGQGVVQHGAGQDDTGAQARLAGTMGHPPTEHNIKCSVQ